MRKYIKIKYARHISEKKSKRRKHKDMTYNNNENKRKTTQPRSQALNETSRWRDRNGEMEQERQTEREKIHSFIKKELNIEQTYKKS